MSSEKTFRQWVFEILENEGVSFSQKMITGAISLLIILNVVAMVISTIPSMMKYESQFFLFEMFSIFIFSIEYLFRLWASSLQKEYSSVWEYMRSPFMIFDVFVLVPALFSLIFPGLFDGRILRIIRVFRIFRLKQYSHSIEKIFSIIHRHKSDLLSSFSLILMAVIISSTFMYYAEKDVQPENLGSIPHALYWGFITVSTVGYGDIAPLTNLGKIITVFTTILGVAIYALPTSILGAAFYAELRSKEAKHVGALERKVSRMEELMKKLNRENNRLKDELILDGKNPNRERSFWEKIIMR